MSCYTTPRLPLAPRLPNDRTGSGRRAPSHRPASSVQQSLHPDRRASSGSWWTAITSPRALGNIIYLDRGWLFMPELSGGVLGCYRCGNVWEPRAGPAPRVCARCKSRLWDVPKLRSIPHGKGLGVTQLVLPFKVEILAAARRRGFSHLRIFGSVRRSQAGPESDVDFLVDRDPEASLLDRASFIEDLESILGRHVDVVPEDALSWLARPQILFEAVPL
jgi:uncharacterized protein